MEILTPLELYKSRMPNTFPQIPRYDLKQGYYEVRHEDGDKDIIFIDIFGNGTYLEESELAAHQETFFKEQERLKSMDKIDDNDPLSDYDDLSHYLYEDSLHYNW